MQRYIFIIVCIVNFSFPLCYGQESGISVDRAMSLSRMADFYYTAHNYEKAIDYEKKSLAMKNFLYGSHSSESIKSILNLAKYHYNRGIENERERNSNISDFVNATRYAKKSMEIIKDTLLSVFEELDYSSRYKLWQITNGIFMDTYPIYVAKNQNDSTLSDLYNTVLFSKGISWKKNITLNTLCWKDIQNALGTNDIAIEFISPVLPSNDNSVFYALTIKKGDNSPKMTKLFDILQLQDSLLTCNTKTEKDQKIGKMVWGPLHKELLKTQNIYFSATHVLNCLPIEYMPIIDTENDNDKYHIFRLTSTIEIVKQKAKSKYNNAVLYGGLQYESSTKSEYESTRSGFEPLPNTFEEVAEIATILENNKIKCKKYIEDQGTKSSFYSLSGKSIDILHLATHGKHIGNQEKVIESVYDYENDLKSSIIILSGANKRLSSSTDNYQNDGILTALDISQMDFSNLDIITLSACESALGEYGFDDSIMGLWRSFKLAGANTILMSLNKVDDEATRILMVEFYRNLMNGKTKHQSLKEAQQYLRKVDNGKYDDPKYWASFIMLDGLN